VRRRSRGSAIFRPDRMRAAVLAGIAPNPALKCGCRGYERHERERYGRQRNALGRPLSLISNRTHARTPFRGQGKGRTDFEEFPQDNPPHNCLTQSERRMNALAAMAALTTLMIALERSDDVRFGSNKQNVVGFCDSDSINVGQPTELGAMPGPRAPRITRCRRRQASIHGRTRGGYTAGSTSSARSPPMGALPSWRLPP